MAVARITEPEELAREIVAVKNTVVCMLETPYPVHYLNVLVQNGIVNSDTAHQAALSYIETTNRSRTFVDMTLYDIDPFKQMSYDDLLRYIQFICDKGLNVSRGRTLCASIL